MIQTAQRPAIQVWKFCDAPEELSNQSTHGGDEDWVALVPAAYKDEWIGWLESGTPFGCCDVTKTDQADGSILFIGAHS